MVCLWISISGFESLGGCQIQGQYRAPGYPTNLRFFCAWHRRPRLDVFLQRTCTAEAGCATPVTLPWITPHRRIATLTPSRNGNREEIQSFDSASSRLCRTTAAVAVSLAWAGRATRPLHKVLSTM